MLVDSTVEFASAVSVAAAAGTALIGNQIPLSVARDIGEGGPIYLVIRPTTEIITGGAAGTIQFILASDATASIATNGTASVHFTSKAFVTDGTDANDAELKVNAATPIVMVQVPMEGVAYEAFLGILCVTATTTTTAGAIDAFLTPYPSKWKAYADGI